MSAFTNKYTTFDKEEEQKLLDEFRERDEALMADGSEEEEEEEENGEGFRSYPNRRPRARFTFSRESMDTLARMVYRSCLFCSFTGDERVVPEWHGYNHPPENLYKGD